MPDQIKISRKARNKVLDLAMPVCLAAAEQIAAACNTESSWGGYRARQGRKVAFVNTTSHSSEVDDGRFQRILRNVDAGRTG